MSAIRVHVFCEGQTEETFIKEVLNQHFGSMGIWLNPIIILTSSHNKKIQKGGVTSYDKIKWQIEKKCKEDPSAWVTTMLDFYGLPNDFPGMNIQANAMSHAEIVRNAIEKDIEQPNFLAYLSVHEFESLLFSKPSAFEWCFNAPEVIQAINNIRSQFLTPEHINNSKSTAPSKRILAICKGYEKTLYGSLLALEIGLHTMRQECPLFDGWIRRIEALAS